MKKLLLLFISIIFSPIFVNGQSEIINGININAPEGFVKSGELVWNKGDEVVNVISMNAIISNEDYLVQCRKASRTTTYLVDEIFEFNGKSHIMCLQSGDNGLAIGQSVVTRDGYSYIITVGVNPVDYEDSYEKAFTQVGYLIGYMIARIRLY
ncbi:MAG: hypothetical protein CMC83_03090 [Flavobacteriaceae bacterium]|nr:hypothetical protein [Flavobacteriaceae bacterium]|tara:strand:+ start:1682 stop:2140 length:459 start_codon:yes stop_codon:yes gene_type:complete